MSRVAMVRSLIEWNKGAMRCGDRLDGHAEKNAVRWHQVFDPRRFYHLRCVLPGEIVFDIGDDRAPGKPTPWADTVRYANAICATLIEHGIPFWCALSGGKGIHVHVFGDGDYGRWPSAMFLIERASRIEPDFECDHRLVDAPTESRLVREFGALKALGHMTPKTLWRQWPRDTWVDLPNDKPACYEGAVGGYPELESADISRFDLTWTAAVGAPQCPVSPKCLEGYNFCDDCGVCA